VRELHFLPLSQAQPARKPLKQIEQKQQENLHNLNLKIVSALVQESSSLQRLWPD